MSRYTYLGSNAPVENIPESPESSRVGQIAATTALKAHRGIESGLSLLSVPENIIGGAINKLVSTGYEALMGQKLPGEELQQISNALKADQPLEDILIHAKAISPEYTQPRSIGENILYRTAEKSPYIAARALGGPISALSGLAQSGIESGISAGLEKLGVGELGQAVGELGTGIGYSKFARGVSINGAKKWALKTFENFGPKIPEGAKAKASPLLEKINTAIHGLPQEHIPEDAKKFIENSAKTIRANISGEDIDLAKARKRWLQVNQSIRDPKTPAETLPYLVDLSGGFRELFSNSKNISPEFSSSVQELLDANDIFRNIAKSKVRNYFNSAKAKSNISKIPILGQFKDIAANGLKNVGVFGELVGKSPAIRRHYSRGLQAIATDNINNLIKEARATQAILDKEKSDNASQYTYLGSKNHSRP